MAIQKSFKQLLPETVRYRYSKQQKLKSRKLIEAVFTKGYHFSNFPLKVFWLPHNDFALLQTGVGVSSRLFKKAVHRNRVKRLMREAYRHKKHLLQEHLQLHNREMSVFFLYIGKELPEYHFLLQKMEVAITRLLKMCDENAERNS
ncbi:MAG: ribonuclease P protein component [Chitinophagaceae bacterium]|nr:MAG: ribonuclease P protein component [Chitinophagaceae bacterium]